MKRSREGSEEREDVVARSIDETKRANAAKN
jgi:hypothetical protein